MPDEDIMCCRFDVATIFPSVRIARPHNDFSKDCPSCDQYPGSGKPDEIGRIEDASRGCRKLGQGGLRTGDFFSDRAMALLCISIGKSNEVEGLQAYLEGVACWKGLEGAQFNSINEL